VTLEEALKQAIATGGLSHLTLAPSKGQWQAGYRATKSGTVGYRVAIKDTPVDALLEALLPGSVPDKEIPDDVDDLIG
jgi:hypothetical protein